MAISFGRWQSYPWKNELARQSERVAIHYRELLSDDFDGGHNPLDMLDRAIVLAGFAIRRMFEKRLVTDKLSRENIFVRTFPSNHSGDFRYPYASDDGGSAFANYSFGRAETKEIKIVELANEVVHASQLMFVNDEDAIPTGLLIASDWHLKDRLLHLTIEEFTSVALRVLEDQVKFTSDQWDPDTGKVHAIRE